MKLKYEMSVMDIGEEKIAVPVDCDFRGVLQMNGITEKIIHLLEQDTDEEKIVSALAEEYEDVEKIRHGVQKVLKTLRSEDLLTE